MKIQRIDTDARLSQAVRTGDLLFIAGQVDDKNEGCQAQAHAVLNKLDTLLAKGGSDRTKLLSATIWLADITDYDAFNAIWEAWIPKGTAPTRACVEAPLAKQAFRVEIAVVAATN